MTNLLILGNINRHTFANSIVAANAKSKKVFEKSLTKIFIIHSRESYILLKNNEDWINHIEGSGLNRELIIDKTIDSSNEKVSVENFTDYIEFIIKGVADSSNIIIDLTNGTSLQKNLLSIVSYILDIKEQYSIDVLKLFGRTEEKGFLPVDILEPCYSRVPDSTRLDGIAYLNLSEIVRYRKIIEAQADKYLTINPEASDKRFFEDNLRHSIQLKLQGDQSKDNAMYRIAASSISASVEDLIRLLVDKFTFSNTPNEVDRRTFGQKLKIIQDKIEKDATSEFDTDFFSKFNDFILYLRNSSTHKGRILTNLEKFKAELSVKMAFPFIEFYTDIIYPLLSNSKPPKESKRIRQLSYIDVEPEETLYYGLDGDDTGKILEGLFLTCDRESDFRKASRHIADAISKISNTKYFR